MDFTARFSYDQLAYTGQAYHYTHPERLAAVGLMHGMHPAPVERCRVLELACGEGANLIPLAYTLPDSTFLGQDLAPTQIATGQQFAAELGLTNLKLEALDLLLFPANAGQFDYIIAHGFYSWSPPAVRDKLLAVCGAHLAPQGVAFVSFNCYPGYHFRDQQRQMMLYHLSRQQTASPLEQARQAVGLLGFVGEAQPPGSDYGSLLLTAKEGYEKLFGRGPQELAYFHHDLLEAVNDAVYFHQFADHAARHRLQFLDEVAPYRLLAQSFPPDVMAALHSLQGDAAAQEQYLDFVACTAFRRVLLCRQEIALKRPPGQASLQALHFAGDFQPQAVAPGTANAPEIFRTRAGEITAGHPVARMAFGLLGKAWPGTLAFPELAARARVNGGTTQELADLLLRLCATEAVDFQSRPRLAVRTVSERPAASPMVRAQAARGLAVVTMRHESLHLPPALRRLLTWLDGQRDHGDLRREWRAWTESAEGRSAGAGSPGAAAFLPAALDTDLDPALQQLVRLGLLAG